MNNAICTLFDNILIDIYKFKSFQHVLSHRVIYATFYEVILPEDTHSFAGFERIKINELEEYAVPRILHRFFEQFIFQP